MIKSRKKAVEDAADMLEGLKLDPTNNLIDTEAMEWKHGGAMFKHLNLPANEDKKSEDTEDTANVLSILASKEVPNAKHLDYTLELALRGDSQKKDPLKNAPFNQLKKEVKHLTDRVDHESSSFKRNPWNRNAESQYWHITGNDTDN